MQKINFNEIKSKEIVPGFYAKFVHSANMTFVYWNIKKDAKLPEHSHPHEQVAHVISGKFEVTLNGETHILKKDDIFIIPPQAKHSGRALTDCQILDTFYPVRKDYL